MKTLSTKMPDFAATVSTAKSEIELITASGAVPPELTNVLRSVPPPHLPEISRLPRPGARCPISGASRTWMVEANDSLPANRKFLFRVRKRGKLRGAVFVNVSKLLAFLREAESEAA